MGIILILLQAPAFRLVTVGAECFTRERTDLDMGESTASLRGTNETYAFVGEDKNEAVARKVNALKMIFDVTIVVLCYRKI